MTSASAINARESARTATGRFGEQEHTAPELELDSMPVLVRGLRPEQVDINVWYDENEDGQLVWQVSAYPIRITDSGFEETDTRTGLFECFELTVTAEQEADLDSDHWTTLSTAPQWLRDTVLPSLVDHPR